MSDPLEIAFYVDRFFRRIHAGLNERAPAVDSYRLGPVGGMLLLTIAEREPVAINDLVTLMARDKSQMTRIIKMIEEKGLICRQVSPDDGRVSLLQLTPQGEKLVIDLKIVLAGVITDVTGPLEDAEMAQLVNLLKKI